MKTLLTSLLLLVCTQAHAADVGQLCRMIGDAGLCTRADFCAEVNQPSCVARDPSNSFERDYCPQLTASMCANNEFQCQMAQGSFRCVPSGR